MHIYEVLSLQLVISCSLDWLLLASASPSIEGAVIMFGGRGREK